MCVKPSLSLFSSFGHATSRQRQGQLSDWPICSIHKLLVDHETGRRPLEIIKPHVVHMQHLKRKMKINRHLVTKIRACVCY